MSNKRFFIIFIILNIMACTSVADEQYKIFYSKYSSKAVNNYRLPSGMDLSYWGIDRDTYFYKSTDNEGKVKAPYWTKGDFNEDGIIDRVYMLFSDTDDSVSVFVFLSKLGQGYKIFKLASANKHMGVRTVSGEELGKKQDVIKLFEFEGHAVLYLWDKLLGQFEKYK